MPLKGTHFEIDFERPVLVFKAGDSIKGSVTFSGRSRGKKIYDAKVTLIRKMDFVAVTEGLKKGKSISQLLRHVDYEKIASESILKDTDSLNIQTWDSKKVQFSLPLPTSLCSSFVGESGVIWYGFMLSAREGSQRSRKDCFLHHRDVAIYGNVSIPTEPKFTAVYKNTVTASTIFTGAAVRMRVSLKKCWAYAGEPFPFTVELFGETTARTVTICLHQNIGYNFISWLRTRSMEPSETKLIYKQECGVEINDGRKECKGVIDVPCVPPTGLGAEGCPYFNLGYMLQFTIHRTGLKLETELFIGMRPYGEEVEEEDEGKEAEGVEEGKEAEGASAANELEALALNELEASKALSSSQHSLELDAQSTSAPENAASLLVEELN